MAEAIARQGERGRRGRRPSRDKGKGMTKARRGERMMRGERARLEVGLLLALLDDLVDRPGERLDVGTVKVGRRLVEGQDTAIDAKRLSESKADHQRGEHLPYKASMPRQHGVVCRGAGCDPLPYLSNTTALPCRCRDGSRRSRGPPRGRSRRASAVRATTRAHTRASHAPSRCHR